MAETRGVCEHLHLPLQSGSDATLAAMHRGYTAERYLDRLAAARAAIDDLAVTTDIIVGLPGRDRRRLRRTLEVVAEAAYDSAYTFIFSPRPGPRRPSMVDEFVAPEVVADRFERLRVGRRALGPGQPRGADRAGRGGPRRGSLKRDPAMLVGSHPPEQARPLRAPTAGVAPAGHLRPGRASPVPARTPARRAGRGDVAAPPASHPHPGGGRVTDPSPWPSSARPPRASRRWPWSWPVATTTSSWSRSTPCRCTGAWTSARPSRRPPSGPRCRHHLIDLVEPSDEYTVSRYSVDLRAPLVEIAGRGHRAVLVGGTGLYVRAALGDLEIPPGIRRCVPSSTPRRTRRSCTAAWSPSIRWLRPGWSPPTAGASCEPSR